MTTRAKPIGPSLVSQVAVMVDTFYRNGLREADVLGFTRNIPSDWTTGQIALARRIQKLLMWAERDPPKPLKLKEAS